MMSLSRPGGIARYFVAGFAPLLWIGAARSEAKDDKTVQVQEGGAQRHVTTLRIHGKNLLVDRSAFGGSARNRMAPGAAPRLDGSCSGASASATRIARVMLSSSGRIEGDGGRRLA